MKVAFAAVALVVAFLGYRVLALEQAIKQLQVNAAIAVLSAEAANNKIGAVAPFFTQDKEAFVKAWLDSNNLPPAVFPEDILVPMKRGLEEKRQGKESEALRAAVFR